MNKLHCTEAILLAVLDGEPVDADVKAHVASCESCADRLEELRDRSLVFSGFVRDEAPVPSGDPGYDPDFLSAIDEHGARSTESVKRRGRPFFRLALAAGLALLFMVPSVRAWVTTTATSLFGDSAVPAAQTVSNNAVGIRPTSTLLSVDLSGQPSSITVREAARDSVSAWIRVPPPAQITASPSGFMITDADDVALTLEVPGSVTTLIVLIDGVVRWRGEVPRPFGDDWRVPL